MAYGRSRSRGYSRGRRSHGRRRKGGTKRLKTYFVSRGGTRM